MAAALALGGVAHLGLGHQLRQKRIEAQWCSKAYLDRSEVLRFSGSGKVFLRCHEVAAFRLPGDCGVRISGKRLVRTIARASAGASGAVANGSTDSKELAILWFKHDLRLDDHPGVAAASAFKQVLPVYVFDPNVCAG